MIRLLFALRVTLDFVGSTGHSGKRTRLSPTRYTEGLSRVDPAREHAVLRIRRVRFDGEGGELAAARKEFQANAGQAGMVLMAG